MKNVLILFVTIAVAGCVSTPDTEHDVRTSESPGIKPPLEVKSISSDAGETRRHPQTDDGLDDYIAIALENNSGLRASFENWAAAMKRVTQATALPEPRLEWTHFVEEIQTRTGPQNNRFMLSQHIPWLSKLEKQGEVSALAAESLWWEVQAHKLAIVRDVKTAYYEYAYVGKSIEIVEQNLSLLKALESIVQRSIQVGASQSPLIRLQVEIGKLENDLASLQGFREPVSAQLRAAMNVEEPLRLPWPLLEDGALDAFFRTELNDISARVNPELQVMLRKIHQAEAMKERARLDRYPDFSVGLMYIETGPAVGSPRPSDSGDDPWAISVGFSLPIWNKKYDAGEREALALKRKATHELRQRQHDLRTEIDLTLYELEDAARQINLFQQTLIPRARQALEVTEISYQSGNATFLDIIDAQRELLTFEKSYWRFLANYKQRVADLELLCGGALS